MRIGKNPQRDVKLDLTKFIHQIIIPVYIPNEEGYFKNSLQILTLSLKSLFLTVHNQTFITIVNNGSCKKVESYLNELLYKNQIHELIHTSNIGKNNAILKGLKGHLFPYITIADADILFLTNWQDETLRVFNSFSKAGVVGLIPQFRLFGHLCHNVLYDNFWSKKLRFTKVKNVEGLKNFYKSVGWDDDYNKDYLKYILTLMSNDKCAAVVGSGHAVATYKRDAIGHNIETSIDEPLSPKYDRLLLDKPVLKIDAWRLTTEDNYAFHMGNVFENWMLDVLENMERKDAHLTYKYPKFSNKENKIKYIVKNHLFRKLCGYKWFFRKFLEFKGLTKEVAKDY
jgi:hypothetical protein